MPAEVDGNVLETLTFPETHGMVDAQVGELLWGTPATLKTQEAQNHAEVAEVLNTPGTHGMIDAQVSETLWRDLSFEMQIDAQVSETLWGVPGASVPQEAQLYAQAIEVLSEPNTVGDVSASVSELFVIYPIAIAAVGNIIGTVSAPATFDASGSQGLISHYRWDWVSVPGGSTIGNVAVPYPDGGAVTPIDMTANSVLYHAEETGGVTGYDTSGNTNDATLTNITLGNAGVVGTYSWSYTLPTSVATISAPVVLTSGEWTISFWFYNLAPNTAWRTGARGVASDHHLVLETGGDRVGVYVGGAFRPTDNGFEMDPASYTGWHQVAVVGTLVGDTRIYVDGAFVGQVTGYRSIDALETIGNLLAGGQRFADQIDEVAVWLRVLEPAEIMDIYYLQNPNYAGVGITYTFVPDKKGTYTINLTVQDAVDLSLDTDTASALIGESKRNPIQGLSLTDRQHLGWRFRNLPGQKQ